MYPAISSARSLFALACCLPLALADGGGWHMDRLLNVVNERLDPVVSPNALASHMHKVFGGSAFGASMSPQQADSSSCTTALLTIDKSNYWVPQMYWINDDPTGDDGAHTFTVIPANARFYYWLTRPSSSNGAPNTAFPPGFRMVVGDPNNKAQLNTGLFTVNCKNSKGEFLGNSFNFDQPCGTIQTIIQFPSCWDGMNLYKSDNSHVKGITNGNSGECPISHPVKIPSIRLEVSWHLSDIGLSTNATAGRLAWANGDTTGQGLHADFANGWDTDILQAALDDDSCSQTDDAIAIQYCKVFAPYADWAATASCKPDRGTIQEKYSTQDGATVKSLPGCNPLWGATGSKPTCATAPFSPDISAWKGNQYTTVYNSTSPWPTDTKGGWSRIGCVNAAPAITGGPVYRDFTNLTYESCQQYCAANGSVYAGVAKDRCYCGNSLDTSQLLIDGCTEKCSGNTSELCGTPYNSQVFFNNAPKHVSTADPAYKGCYADTLSRLLTQMKFTSNSMTPNMCRSACAEASPLSTLAAVQGYTCYCGTDAQLGGAMLYPDTTCLVKCPGNSTQTCGGTYLEISVWTVDAAYKATVAANMPAAYSNPQYIGCRGAGTNGAALMSYSYQGSDVKPDTCVALCAAQGYSLTGIINGNQCRCGNSYAVPLTLAPSIMCNLACAGNTQQYCGGQNSYMSIYNSTGQGADTEFEGCYKSTSTARPVGGGASFTDHGMTNAMCRASCADWKYSYAATSGTSCVCGNTVTNSGGGMTVATQCSQACEGNTTDTCGGSYRWSVYNTADVVVPTFAPGYQGCYVATSPTSLFQVWRSQTNNTGANCASTCRSLGFPNGLAGTQGSWCGCGARFYGSSSRLGDGVCNAVCPGGSDETCGCNAPRVGYKSVSLFNVNGTSPYSTSNIPYAGIIAPLAGTTNGTSSATRSSTAQIVTLSALSTGVRPITISLAGVSTTSKAGTSTTASSTTAKSSSTTAKSSTASSSTAAKSSSAASSSTTARSTSTTKASSSASSTSMTKTSSSASSSSPTTSKSSVSPVNFLVAAGTQKTGSSSTPAAGSGVGATLGYRHARRHDKGHTGMGRFMRF